MAQRVDNEIELALASAERQAQHAVDELRRVFSLRIGDSTIAKSFRDAMEYNGGTGFYQTNSKSLVNTLVCTMRRNEKAEPVFECSPFDVANSASWGDILKHEKLANTPVLPTSTTARQLAKIMTAGLNIDREYAQVVYMAEQRVEAGDLLARKALGEAKAHSKRMKNMAMYVPYAYIYPKGGKKFLLDDNDLDNTSSNDVVMQCNRRAALAECLTGTPRTLDQHKSYAYRFDELKTIDQLFDELPAKLNMIRAVEGGHLFLMGTYLLWARGHDEDKEATRRSYGFTGDHAGWAEIILDLFTSQSQDQKKARRKAKRAAIDNVSHGSSSKKVEMGDVEEGDQATGTTVTMLC